MLALLLPPSEGKATGGSGPGWDPGDGRFGPALRTSRATVARALAKAHGGDAELLGVGGDALARSRAANRSLAGAPCLPAWQRYTGVVWDHFDVATLAPGARARAADAVVVLSAVAGLVALDDPLPDHRLKFSVSLGTLGRLAAFWRGPLSDTLNQHLAGHLVVDLLPTEHRAAWRPDPDGYGYDLRRVRFVASDSTPGGHWAKAAKGALARALVEARSAERALERWRDDRFQLEIE